MTVVVLSKPITTVTITRYYYIVAMVTLISPDPVDQFVFVLHFNQLYGEEGPG